MLESLCVGALRPRIMKLIPVIMATFLRTADSMAGAATILVVF